MLQKAESLQPECGLKRLAKRVYRRMSDIQFWLFLPIFLPLVAVIRALRPFFLVRFKIIYTSRLGHFAGEPDYYLARLANEPAPPRTLDLFGFDSIGVCNKQLAKMWSRKMRFIPLLRHLERANKIFPGWEPNAVPWNRAIEVKPMDIPAKPFLQFTATERDEGERRLSEITGGRTGPIVCVFNRDSAYLKETQEQQDWSYHDYRDSDIANYVPAMEWLADQGYLVMRMGARVSKTLLSPSDSVIDYASNWRSDFMDVYLLGACEFFVGTSTGPATLAGTFRKSGAHVNVSPFLTFQVLQVAAHELFVPKLYFSERLGRIMSISEIVESGTDNLGMTEAFRAAGIQLVENDPEDILIGAREIKDLVSGELTPTEEDLERQKAFWRISGVDASLARHYPQPSPGFLKRHEPVLFN